MSSESIITIDNIKNDEIVNFPILLLRGTITKYSNNKLLKILINNNEVKHDYSIQNSIYKFTSLFYLQFGVNHLKLIYNDSSKELKINRQKSENKNVIIPIYIIVTDHNGYYQSDSSNNTPDNACQRIQLGLELIQTMYAQKVPDKKTFTIESNCKIFKSKLKLSEAFTWTSEDIWNFLAREIISNETQNYENHKYVGFLSCTTYQGLHGLPYTYENIFKNVKANPTISAGGLALLGTGCLYSWSENIDQVQLSLQNTKKVDIEKLFDDSNYRQTYGGCYSTSLGALAHEIGHLFDLGHTKDGIMGNGIDFIHRVFLSSNLTEILTDRLVCGQNSIKSPKKPSRFTKIKKPGKFLTSYHEQKNNDLSFFTKNCQITLEYHKWFNVTQKRSVIKFDLGLKKIESDEFCLKLVELREVESAMLIDYWDFNNDDDKKFSFVFSDNIDLVNVTIFAINENGDILKINV